MKGKPFKQLVKEHYDSLSAGKKKAAKYLVEHLEEASYCTMAMLQGRTGVSETTIIRLAYSLGFSGFSAMQKAIQLEVMALRQHGGNEEGESGSDDELAAVLNRDIAILQEVKERLDSAVLRKIAKKIEGANQVYVIGQRTSYAPAFWFSYTLGFMVSNVQLVDERMAEQALLNIDKDSVIIAISFPRYHKATYRFAEMAKMAGAYVVAVTDGELAPIAKLASINLFTKTNRDMSGYNGIAPVLSLLNMLIVAVRKNEKQEIHERLSKVEEIYKRNDLLIE
ncbi:hypothetical protein CHH78_06460 [Shouchella clausii]|uniref:MurR/RpiR family transcriptional regulator n=1 Tax=Shouchella clausii TaxID=79880 RepID=A0A268S125_SHOCL|nr:MurR/RpiR family transcriptional regulator [Shouchella clausii]PAD44459.1 hypothetical protein CHH54_02300 [Bacillus sp. 7520-S]PAD09769.1 hypothetical protein CHH76_07535 [Shouchella clausii]PAE84719.1 hypothetical protein CHH78_06460 [Shouchella clausii]PAE99172.1 hypothetical protein CHH71_00670 [Shouchella clausii]PAF05967.1 hypothetical protein CHH66_06755 [Shouchella clausii]